MASLKAKPALPATRPAPGAGCSSKPDVAQSLLEAAGFGEIRVAVLRIDKRVADAAAFTRALVYGNPLIEQIRARGGVDPERVVDAFAEALLREFGADPMRIPLQAIVIEARRR
jgi:hypothetical protein